MQPFGFIVASLLWYTVGISYVFQPPHAPSTTFIHMARDLQAGPLTYRASDGVVLRGILVPAISSSAPYVLVFYGNAEIVPYESNRLLWLRGLGYNVVCFDYRGYGYSEGRIDAAKIRNDSVALYDYVVKSLETSHQPAFVYGISLGTQFAIHVAAERRVRGLLLQSPPASADEEVRWQAHRVLGIASSIVAVVPSPDVKLVLQGVTEIRRSNAPLIVVHGAVDSLIPLSQGREVFVAAPTRDKRFIAVARAGHGDIPFNSPPAGPAVAQFLRQHAGNSAAWKPTREVLR